MANKNEDWALLQDRLPGWQEESTKKLLKEYVEFLESDAPALEKFWELEKKIKKDKNTPSVQLIKDKKGLEYDLMRLIQSEVITFDDLEGFSDETVAEVHRLVDAFA